MRAYYKTHHQNVAAPLPLPPPFRLPCRPQRLLQLALRPQAAAAYGLEVVFRAPAPQGLAEDGSLHLLAPLRVQGLVDGEAPCVWVNERHEDHVMLVVVVVEIDGSLETHR